MIWIYWILLFLATFLIMECITWLTHKFVMHGFLWVLHRDHHQQSDGFFEKNDWFFVIFAIPSIALIYNGTMESIWWQQAIGFGIMAYGAAYFLVHDIIIHQRFKLFTKSTNQYVLGIRWAHKMHHKHLNKEHGESFGMLYVHRKYREKVKRDKLMMKQRQMQKVSQPQFNE